MSVSNSKHQQDVESIFQAALAHGVPNERAAFLEGACAGDTALRVQIEALLQAHEDAGDFLIGQTTERPIEGPGEQIGRYKTLQLIGEGGFGTVYMAEQLEPVRRKVALKIIKLGMDTKQVIARFEAERQALALMDHPNIAKVFDAGSTDSGRPYFVMELVRGIPITEYCDQNNLDSRARLELFLEVCNAMQHAHQKGIIHRDIKPSNVMVTLHDGRAVPKIIDFGVSKATNQRLTEKTLFTEYHQFIGTPQYMSPEQAGMSGLDIDTRSDLYSLGALLYELLTGTPPFDKSKLRDAGYAKIQQIICEQDPPKPSTRVVTLIQQDTTIAKHHGVHPQAFSRQLRGELDCIVMKAMEKDRTRRYATASELAADIARYLDDQPVIAAPPGLIYIAKKFVSRHRLGVVASALIATSLLAGCILAIVGFVQANREVQRTKKIANYLRDVLVVSDPRQELAMATDLDRVVDQANQIFGDDPATVAAVLNSLSLQLQAAGNYSAAEDLLHESIRIWKRTQGPNDANINIAMTRLGNLLALKGDDSAAESALRESITIAENRQDEVSPYLANALIGLAEILQNQSHYDEAESALRRAIAIRREVSPHQKLEIAVTISRLANLISMSGKTAELEPVLDECIEAFREAMPSNRAIIAKILTQSAAFHIDHENFDKAEQQLREALAIYRKDSTASKFYRDVAVRYLSIIVDQLDDNSIEYIAKRRQFLNYARNTLGEDHPRLGLLLSDYSKYMVDHHRPLEAIGLATDALSKLDKTYGLESYIKGALVSLESAVRTIALDSGKSFQQYQQAVDGINILVQRELDNESLSVIQGALDYRMGRYADALDRLTAWQSEADRPLPELLMSTAFLTMSHERLGHRERAMAELRRMREQINDPAFAEIEFAAALSNEVQQMLEGTNPNQDPKLTVNMDSGT